MPYENMSDTGFSLKFDDSEIDSFVSDTEYFEYLAEKANTQD